MKNKFINLKTDTVIAMTGVYIENMTIPLDSLQIMNVANLWGYGIVTSKYDIFDWFRFNVDFVKTSEPF